MALPRKSLGKSCLLEGKSVADVIVKSLKKNGSVTMKLTEKPDTPFTFMNQTFPTQEAGGEGLCNAGTFIPAHENMYNKHSNANGTFELRTYPSTADNLVIFVCYAGLTGADAKVIII